MIFWHRSRPYAGGQLHKAKMCKLFMGLAHLALCLSGQGMGRFSAAKKVVVKFGQEKVCFSATIKIMNDFGQDTGAFLPARAEQITTGREKQCLLPVVGLILAPEPVCPLLILRCLFERLVFLFGLELIKALPVNSHYVGNGKEGVRVNLFHSAHYLMHVLLAGNNHNDHAV